MCKRSISGPFGPHWEWFLEDTRTNSPCLVPGLPSDHMMNISSGIDLYICRADMDT